MKKYKVTVEKEITIEFDENSPEFKELWESYKKSIDDRADYESFAENIASQISRYGLRDFIEGVGYVKHYGENQMIFNNGEYSEQTGYVNVEVDTDLNSMIDFEIAYITDENLGN